MNIKDTALFWLNSGIATVPLAYKSKVPLVKWGQYRTRLPALAEIDLWYDDNRLKNLAIICGWMNLVVLDFDSPENLSCWYVWQLIHNPKILETYRTMTSRGLHYYYYLSDPAHLDSIQGALFEVKTAGKLCTCPPSVHESGRAYQPLSDPMQIRTVKAEEILNYSPVALHTPIVWLPRSKFAPVDTDKSSIEAIKEGISILEFIPNARPIDPQQHYWQGDCPIHGRHGNFWVDKQKNIGGCWAGCGNFDVISLWARLNNISNSEAVKQLARLNSQLKEMR